MPRRSFLILPCSETSRSVCLAAKTSMLPLTVWMNMPSFHQDELFTRLAESGEVDLRVVFAKELTTERVRLGWNAGRRQYEHRTLGSRYAVVEAARLARRERDR